MAEIDSNSNIDTTSDSSTESLGTDSLGTETSAAGSYQSVDGIVSIEVENFLTNTAASGRQWIASDKPQASGNGSMVTDPDTGLIRTDNNNSPEMQYRVTFTEPGIYNVWARGWGDTVRSEGRSDSVHIGINGTLDTAKALQHFPAGWHWSQARRDGGVATINVPSAGTHTINIWMREDGLILDKLLLVQSDSFIPDGTGPAETSAIVVPDETTETSNPTDTSEISGPVETSEEPITTTTSESGSTSAGGVSVEIAPDNDVADDNESNDVATNDSPTNSVSTETSAAGNYQSVNGIVSIEVENFLTNTAASGRQWIDSDKPQASGNGSMVTDPDTGLIRTNNNNSPEMQYRVTFTEPGIYTVWARGWGDTVGSEGRRDSVHIGINGTLDTAKALQHFPAGWHWSQIRRDGGIATINVPSAGTHTINIWMREDGLILDKLLLVKSDSFTPSGTGPDETSVASAPEASSKTSADSSDTPAVATNTIWQLVQTRDGSTVDARHETGGVELDGKLLSLIHI